MMSYASFDPNTRTATNVSLAWPRPLVYLACPYSGTEEEKWARFHAANLAASKLLKDGLAVFSPISHTHPITVDAGLPGNWDFWEGYDRAFLSVSSKVIVLKLKGWEISKGVQAEIEIAKQMGIPVEFMEPV